MCYFWNTKVNKSLLIQRHLLITNWPKDLKQKGLWAGLPVLGEVGVRGCRRWLLESISFQSWVCDLEKSEWHQCNLQPTKHWGGAARIIKAEKQPKSDSEVLEILPCSNFRKETTQHLTPQHWLGLTVVGGKNLNMFLPSGIPSLNLIGSLGGCELKHFNSLGFNFLIFKVQIIKWKSLSHVQLFATPWAIQSTEFSRPEHWSG